MALASGTRFGPYEIADQIGKGGMGEVYRATDMTLDRDVAIKVLPESFASDADRVARFEQEAKILASLNHANIAQIHGLEKADNTTAIVMELVEGPTLADRIEQGPIPPDEALNIAMQIADGLEAAHEQGIVHRDLKPANIKLRPDGTVKVLDFGIAKAFEPLSGLSGPQSPVMTTPVTQAGIILGTAAYMSPEQARGKFIDQRTDIWAFGCVLYEMLTGQPAFGGEDVPITLARVLAHDTDMDSLPAMISPAVSQTLRLCLQKDPKQRVADIRDVKLAFQGAFDTSLPLTAEVVAQPIWRRALPVAAALVVGGLVVGLGAWGTLRPEPAAVARFDYDLPVDHNLRNTGRPIMALSPDGRRFVYNTFAGLYLRTIGELEAQLIPGTDEDLLNPFFSPDGQSIAYYVFGAGQLKRIAISGGAPVVIASGLTNLDGASWGADGTILFGQPEGIFRVSSNGGTPELIISGEGKRVYGPRYLPGGDGVLFSLGALTAGGWNAADIVVATLSTGERTVLIEGGSDAHYLPTGHLVYALEDGLFAIAFDVDDLSVSGGPVPVVQGVMRANNDATGAANFAVAHSGTLVYVRGDSSTVGGGLRSLVWVDREGRQEPIDVPPRSYVYAQLSPDGTRIVLDIRDQENDTWIWDLARQTLQRLTFDAARNRGAVWSPDGVRVAFSREIDGSEEIYWQAADGSGTAEALTEGSGVPMFPVDITPDGTTLLYTTSDLPRDTFMIPVAGPATTATPLLDGIASEGAPTVSPDGRWLAYTSDESGDYEVYVRPFPDIDTGRWQISTAGGMHPHWSRDGTELFYMVQQVSSVAMMAVSVESGSTFTPGAPQTLFDGPYYNSGGEVAGPDGFDVSLDGQRFLMITDVEAGLGIEQPEIIIVQNWVVELNRLVPTE